MTKRNTQRELLGSEEKYHSLIESTQDPIYVVDRNLRYQYANRPYLMRLGVKLEKLIGKSYEEFHSSKENILKFYERVKDIFKHGKSNTYENRSERDGKYFLRTLNPIKDSKTGKIIAITVFSKDITELKQAEDKLLYNALHDPLTDLPNRALFLDRLEHAVELTKKHKDFKFSVLFLDLDRFKDINDSLGHTAGDEILKKVSLLLKKTLRSEDTIARLGGDEFGILIENIPEDSNVIHVADMIIKKLRKPLKWKGKNIFITLSIGIVLSNVKYNGSEEMLRDADIAMYRSKELGKNRYEIFDKSMRDKIMKQLRLEADLRRALKSNQFLLYYQPIISLKSQKIVGVEALLRWDHPELGLLSPDEFIDVAEETGLIAPITKWVLEEACVQNRSWQEIGFLPLRTAVNFSPQLFYKEGVIDLIERVIKKTNIYAKNLTIEITENTAMEHMEHTVKILKGFKKIGVQISLDDFGKSYSSLSYLSHFPITYLKIDKSFIQNCSKKSENASIISAIIALAHILRLKVIAEGVETKEQFQFLCSQGCDQAQGYLFSRPVSPEAFINKTLIPSR